MEQTVDDFEIGFFSDWRGRLGEKPPALDKAPMIGHALRFANTGSAADYRAMMRGVSFIIGDSPDPLSKERLSNERQAFREALSSLVKGRVTPQQKALWIGLANRVLPVPTYKLVGKTLRIETRYAVMDVTVPLGEMLCLVLLWLMDPHENLGARLKQCHYAKCGNFSIAQPIGKQGRSRTMYCDVAATYPDDHMKMAHNERKRNRKARKPK